MFCLHLLFRYLFFTLDSFCFFITVFSQMMVHIFQIWCRCLSAYFIIFEIIFHPLRYLLVRPYNIFHPLRYVHASRFIWGSSGGLWNASRVIWGSSGGHPKVNQSFASSGGHPKVNQEVIRKSTRALHQSQACVRYMQEVIRKSTRASHQSQACMRYMQCWNKFMNSHK